MTTFDRLHPARHTPPLSVPSMIGTDVPGIYDLNQVGGSSERS
jgi:hypothetical protein